MTMEHRKVQTPLPIGVSSFSDMIERGYYYVDKTLFIKDILDKQATVTLCTRPRRFGKTLSQTMLKCFFEDTSQLGGADTRKLFNGLKIEGAGAEYMAHQGKYPVIMLSFKEGKRETFERSYSWLVDELAGEFKRHHYVSEKISDSNERVLFDKLRSGEGTLDDYSKSLKFLCKCLTSYYGQKAIILIDEYDVPLENSWVCGFYNEMINFIRPLLSSALKDNTHLLFAVITGCLRISKESIFTGLNNLDMVTILTKDYSEYFGFTQNEMDAMLEHYGFMEKRQLVKDWYDGYLFGNTEVYNPWSSIYIVRHWLADINEQPTPYWSNTSSNDIVRKLIDIADNDAKADLETLMTGGTISKLVYEDITYGEIEKDADHLWNFLFFTGYLKKVGESVDDKERIIIDLKIPNKEVGIIYENKVQEWFKEKIRQRDFSRFYEAILSGNAETVQEELGEFLLSAISYMDGKEDFYHGVMVGMLNGLRNYNVKSNRETGRGRCDIVLKHVSGRGRAVIFELKWTPDMREIEKKSEEALKQIEIGMYVKELEDECYNNITKYGVAFCKKSCEVRLGE